MLGNPHFRNGTIRKVVVGFGTIFNDITVARYDKALNKYHSWLVPIVYGPKEKYITRIISDPTLTKSVAISVPRISFTLDALTYDPSRKQQSTLQNFNYSSTNGLTTQYAPVPYNFDFTLSVYVRNTEDGTQIIEQILPFFTPDYTVKINFIPEMGTSYEMPVILNSVSTEIDYEGDMMSTRLIIWDLTFTAKGYLFPPAKTDSSQGLIGTWSDVGGPNGTGGYGAAFTDIYTESDYKTIQEVVVDIPTGHHIFSTSEIVRVSNRKNIAGKIIYFSNDSRGIVIVGELNKPLEPGDILVGDYSNASYTILSVSDAPYKVVRIITKPDPEDATVDDEYGFSEQIIEYG